MLHDGVRRIVDFSYLSQQLVNSPKDRSAALNLLSQANQALPNDPEVQFVLAQLLTQSGQWNEAAQLLEVLTARDLPTSFYTGFFRAVVEGGLVPQALAILEKSGTDDRWRPRYEALRAARAGTSDYLRRVAPEVRVVALKILRQIAPRTISE